MLKQIKFGDWKDIEVSLGTYHDGLTRILLLTEKEPLMVATTNVGKVVVESIAKILGKQKERLVLIKDWSENEGIFKELVRAGYIKDLIYGIPTGHCVANLAELTDEAWELKNK